MGKKWTSEDDEKLKTLLSQEYSHRDTAKLLKRSVGSIHTRRYHLGYTKKKEFTEKLLERAKQHREKELD